MKFYLPLILCIVAGCSLQQTKLADDKLEIEATQVVQLIKNKPEWLDINDICPSKIVPDVEKDVHYLDEKCQTGPISCLENCKNEDGNACYALALFLQKQKGFDVEEANPLFLRSCHFGIVSGCTNLAAYKFDLDKNDKVQTICAADTFEKTCEKNDPWGCSMFGTVLAYGSGRKSNTKEAIKYLDKACEKFGSDDPACQGAMKVKQQIQEFEKNTSTK